MTWRDDWMGIYHGADDEPTIPGGPAPDLSEDGHGYIEVDLADILSED